MAGPVGRAVIASLAILLQAVVVSAQSGTTALAASATGTAPSSTATKVIDVTVNKGSTHRFSPEQIIANVGDVISFHFYPTNHSVVKAEYGYPCVPYSYVEPGTNDMFYSGNYPLQATDSPPVWNLTVNSTAPVFFYCSALESCNKQGMLGVINPNSTQTLDFQRAAAIKAGTIQLSPGDPVPAEASSTLHSAMTPTPTATTSTSTPVSSTLPASSDNSHSLSGGAIAGIAVGGVAVILVCGLLFFYIGRTKSLKDILNRNSATLPVSQNPRDPGFGGFGYQSPQPNDYRHSNLPPYGSPYTGPPSEAPGSPAFAPIEVDRSGTKSPMTESIAHAELASPKVAQHGPAELA